METKRILSWLLCGGSFDDVCIIKSSKSRYYIYVLYFINTRIFSAFNLYNSIPHMMWQNSNFHHPDNFICLLYNSNWYVSKLLHLMEKQYVRIMCIKLNKMAKRNPHEWHDVYNIFYATFVFSLLTSITWIAMWHIDIYTWTLDRA